MAALPGIYPFPQASLFETGANSLVTFAQTTGTPITAPIIIGLAIAAAVGKMSLSFGSARRSILRLTDPVNAGLFEADHQSSNLIWTRRKDA